MLNLTFETSIWIMTHHAAIRHIPHVKCRNLVGSPSWFTSSQHDRNWSSHEGLKAEWTTQNWAQKRSPENGTSQIFTIIYILVCSCCSCCSCCLDHGTIDGSKWIRNQMEPALVKELHRGMEHHHHEVARRTERLVHRRKIRWFLELINYSNYLFCFCRFIIIYIVLINKLNEQAIWPSMVTLMIDCHRWTPETWSGERSAELVSTSETRNPKPETDSEDLPSPGPIETRNPKPETDSEDLTSPGPIETRNPKPTLKT